MGFIIGKRHKPVPEEKAWLSGPPLVAQMGNSIYKQTEEGKVTK